MKTRKTKKSQAFTLIEMLVVIAIIGILTTLMVSGYLRSRQNAIDTRAKANVENIRGAMATYYSIKLTWPPVDSWANLMSTLTSNGLIDQINESDGGTTYSVMKCEVGTCSTNYDYDYARVCASCLLPESCENTSEIVDGQYCVFVR